MCFAQPFRADMMLQHIIDCRVKSDDVFAYFSPLIGHQVGTTPGLPLEKFNMGFKDARHDIPLYFCGDPKVNIAPT